MKICFACIVLLLLIIHSKQSKAQGYLQYFPDNTSIAWNSTTHEFLYLKGGNNDDSLKIENKVIYQAWKPGDTVEWEWKVGYGLFIASYNPKSKSKKTTVTYSIVPDQDSSLAHLKSGKIKIPSKAIFSHFHDGSVYFKNSDKKETIELRFLQNHASKILIFKMTENNALIVNKPIQIITGIGNKVYNPYGPDARLIEAGKNIFTNDSILSFPLAQLKKSILQKGNTFLWEIKSSNVNIFSDTLKTDYVSGKRELHQVEFYVEEKNFNEGTVRGIISDIYPDLFSAKQIIPIPFYKKNGIRGFQFSWYTMPLLQLQFKPRLVNNAPVLIIIRNSKDSHMVGNALYPETLFMEDSMFLEIYSKPDPVFKTHSILGSKCIDAMTECNAEWIKSAAQDWFLRAGCTLDKEVTLNYIDSNTTGIVFPSFQNIIVVSVQCGEPLPISIRLDSSENWGAKKLYPMYDYPANIIYNASGSFIKKTASYQYRILQKIECKKGWVLFFSKKDE